MLTSEVGEFAEAMSGTVVEIKRQANKTMNSLFIMVPKFPFRTFIVGVLLSENIVS